MSQTGSRTSNKTRNKSGKAKSTERYTNRFPGALPLRLQIICKDPARGTWKEATVVHCRPKDELQHVPKEPDDYKYYVHFYGHDRRLDCWVDYSKTRPVGSVLPEGETFEDAPDVSSDEEHAKLDQDYLREHEENTKLKTIHHIRIGPHKVETWYFSPYPKDFQDVDCLHICELCLSFFKTEGEINSHKKFCQVTHPPGNEIFRNRKIAMFELDGSFAKTYCENLCYISKLFLDHKTLKHPVCLFLFYVLTEITPKGYVPAGYFSKEKYSRNNLSCICTLPHHQRKGFGKLLIQFSYVLSKEEGKRGTPERPLSDLGRASYLSYWTSQILEVLKQKDVTTISQIADATCIEVNDIIRTLNYNKLILWKGDKPFLCLLPEKIEQLEQKFARPLKKIDRRLLHWEPYDAYLAPAEFCPAT